MKHSFFAIVAVILSVQFAESAQPTGQPSMPPTGQPSSQPSSQPTAQPSSQSLSQPTAQPSSHPSSQPTAQPSSQPTAQPTSQPTEKYSAIDIPLGGCTNFAVQAGTAVSFDGVQTTLNTGSVGVAPGTEISGNFKLVTGAKELNSPNAILCTADLKIAYDASSQATCHPSNILQSSDMAGITLTPGVYCSASGKLIISAGTVTLDGLNYQDAQWIFQTATSLVTSTATSFILQNGALSSNVYWSIGSSATIGYSSSFVGTILSHVSITYGSSSAIVGRGLAMAAVTFDSGSTMALPTGTIVTKSTGKPSGQPTNQPSAMPTSQPTVQPTVAQPTESPLQVSRIPSFQPTMIPTSQPTMIPTFPPTMIPTSQPTMIPTSQPTIKPTSQPTMIPTFQPTIKPTSQPTIKPTSQPTMIPTSQPTIKPTSQPTMIPSSQPTMKPTSQPTMKPTSQPTMKPTSQPTIKPTSQPTMIPTSQPTIKPTSQPTAQPTPQPTGKPSTQRTTKPTARPSPQPLSRQPSSQPTLTLQPSAQPTSGATLIPLGLCQNFAVQAGTAVSFNGALTTLYTGSVGVAPGTSITGNYALITGAVEQNSPKAIICAADLGIAYAAAAGAICPPANILQNSDLSGVTLFPGVYSSASGFFVISASTVTLDGNNSTDAQWIFQTSTTLVTATATSFILQNGAKAGNIFWAIGSSASIGYSSSFAGTILAGVSVTFGSSSQIVGRGLALAAVTFASGSTITMPAPTLLYSAFPTPNPTQSPSRAPSVSPTFVPSLLPTAVPSVSPTIAARMPTPVPTISRITSINVMQQISGISVTEAASPAFKLAMQGSAALSANVGIDKVTIESIVSYNTSTSRRALLSSGANVVYSISTLNGDAASFSSALSASVASGEMSRSLQVYGFSSAAANSVTVRITSPTSSPTNSPSSSKYQYTYASDAIIIGATIGSVIFTVIIALIAFYMCLTCRKNLMASSSVPSDQTPNNVPEVIGTVIPEGELVIEKRMTSV